ncbi:MAG: Flp pilus assembly complex ATPase component TadA [Planctomycetaceae bacterium]|jgi:type II secretory ATPase GspE/PulE/Tfp pilus assembly ATPase PilB-like protein|nr:Flp pilus assembly complex ATPase component TadA [Planctomycetaceae bacterium]
MSDICQSFIFTNIFTTRFLLQFRLLSAGSLFFLLSILLLISGDAVLAQTLMDTGAAMSISSDMDGGGAQSATKPRGGAIGKIGEANAQRNAEINEAAAPAGEPAAAPAAGDASGGNAAAPAQKSQGDILKEGWWGPGGYISPIKLPLYILVFLIWVGCASWVNSDQERLKKESREALNFLYLMLYTIVGTIFFFVPIFWVAFPATVLLCIVPVMVYVVKRNKPLPPHEKVLTGEHLFYLYAVAMNKIGVKIKVKKRQSYQTGPSIEMEAIGKNIDPKILQGRLIVARNSPGYNLFREHIFDALTSNATSMMFDFTPERTAIRHLVDGVWLDLAPIPRVIEKGKNKDSLEEMLESAKLLIGANPNDRRSRQTGMFVAALGGGKKKKKKYEAEFISQGTKTGEAVMIQFTASKVPFKNLNELGMRPEIQPKLLEQLNARQGIFIVSAPQANGLRSSMDVFTRICDRFTRDVVNIEDAALPTEAIENVVLVLYDSSKGETPLTVLPDALFKEPHALIVRDMSSLDTLQLCCKEVDMHRLFITTVRAKDGVEAILRFLAVKIPPQLFIPRLNGVINQRLIRKLCPACKEPYQPAPQLLQQLGLRPDQVKEFYRTRTPLPEPEERKRGICPNCNGIGYRGRTALFELLVLSDSIRELILSNPNPALIRQQFTKEGQTGFLYEGIHLLIKGETTVEEFSRVMKM